jgi:5-methyltetrahydrofolate--homocysteine methyltransferase
MSAFLDILKQRVIVLDGAMGTMVQALTLTDADFGGPDFRMLSDLLVFSRPEDVKNIHLAYYRAGSDAVETNTFGASPFRLSEYDFSTLDLSCFAPIPRGVDLRSLSYEEFAYQLSRAAAEVAGRAREERKQDPDYDGRPLFVVGSIGPSNRVLSSTKADLKVSTFDDISENFRGQVLGLIDGGADVILYETQQDVLELKAAVAGGLRAMEERGVRLPIMAQVTVDKFGKMQIFNTDIHAALVTMEGVGADVFGVNCSIGPDLMLPTVQKLSRFSHLPISVLPNAGLPEAENGKTVFRLTPDDLARHLRVFVEEYGVNIVGGCCGTNPSHIRAIAAAVHGLKPAQRVPDKGLYISGPQKAVLLDSANSLIRFGERLNVRGSKKVRNAIESDGPIDHVALEEVVTEQVKDLGLDIIDVCMDSNLVDTPSTLSEVIHMQTTDFSGAMCIDSFDVAALAKAIKSYPGRPIVNSISMEEVEPGLTKLDAVMRETKSHNPVYIGLCTGPKGPAGTAAEKLELATQIIGAAAMQGVSADRLFIDVNVFPIGSESVPGMNFSVETLEGVRLVKHAFPKTHTTLGVGNLTAGLASKPYMRMVITSVFLDEGRKRGLDAAIVNPNHYVFVSDIDPAHYELARRVILEHDMDAFADLEAISLEKKGGAVAKRSGYDDLETDAAICEKIKDGFKERASGSFEKDGHSFEYADKIVLQVAEAIDRHPPLTFISDYLMNAMKELGDGFARGEVSLPHLLKSADVMQHVMGFLEKYMRATTGAELLGEVQYKGVVVLGTVYQDVHSIGKDLAKTLLENYGYRVVDLGAMTPLQSFIDAAKEHNADAVGMSALLVQTSNHMIAVSKMMAEQGLADTPILIGGAPVNERHAAYVAMAGSNDPCDMRSNIFYCRTAMDGVNVMNALMSDENLDQYLEENGKRLASKLRRAEQMAEEEAALIARLPRRAISFESTGAATWRPGEFAVPGEPAESIIGANLLYKMAWDIRRFAPYVNTRNLFSLNWRFGGAPQRKKHNTDTEYLLRLFDEWIEQCGAKGWILPQGVMGLFPCQSDGDEIILFDAEDLSREIARFDFTVVVGAERNDIVSGAQYFPAKTSGAMGVVGLQITTAGAQVESKIEEFKKAGDSESALFLQGLSDRIAEDMAEYVHGVLRGLVGVDCGIRWSPGYPGMTNIENNHTIYKILGAENSLRIRITDAGEFIPTGTTAAVVSFHSDARYT